MDAVFILGMHRSGTSCLAACLQACGLFLGDVNRRPRSANNPYGTFEPHEVSELNERLLGSWVRPRLPVAPTPADLAAIEACALALQAQARSAGASRLGIKDPRMLLVLPLWRVHFERVQLVASFRSAAAVHRSIAARGELRTWKGANLKAWKTYNRALLELSAREHVHLVSFELAPVAYEQRIRSVCEAIGLQYDPVAVRASFDPAARHASPAAFPRDGEVAEIQERLERQATG